MVMGKSRSAIALEIEQLKKSFENWMNKIHNTLINIKDLEKIFLLLRKQWLHSSVS